MVDLDAAPQPLHELLITARQIDVDVHTAATGTDPGRPHAGHRRQNHPVLIRDKQLRAFLTHDICLTGKHRATMLTLLSGTAEELLERRDDVDVDAARNVV